MKQKSQISGTVIIYAFVAVVISLGLIFGYRAITTGMERGIQVELLRLTVDIESDIKTLMPQFASIETYTYRAPEIIEKVCFADLTITDPNAIGNKNLAEYPLIKDSVESGVNDIFFVSEEKIELMDKIGRIKIGNDARFACFDVRRGGLEITMSGRGTSTMMLKEFVNSIDIPAGGANEDKILSSVDGVMTLTIPAGTRATKDGMSVTTISIELIPLLDIDKASALRTELYQFEPDGTVFSNPIELTMKFYPEAVGGCPGAFAFYQHDAEGNLKAEIRSKSVDCIENTATFELNSFSTGGGGPIEPPPEACGNGTCDPGETCTSCPADCGCSPGYECIGGICEEEFAPPIPPEVGLYCELAEDNCSNNSICLFSMFNYTNSHVALCDSDYSYKVCCNLSGELSQGIIASVIDVPCSPGEGFVGSMFQSYNSHLDSKYSSQGGFPSNICLSSLTPGTLLSCHTFNDGSENGYCDYGTCVATMYQENNSHVAGCITDTYSVSICCSFVYPESLLAGNCDDGMDNDADGFTDENDTGCLGCLSCSDCGLGMFDICTQEECTSCGDGCYYYPGLITGKCYSCDELSSCEGYEDSEQACLDDNCGYHNCLWNVSTCCTDNDNDGVCAADDPDDLNPLIPLCSDIITCSDYETSEECLVDECGITDCNWNETICCLDEDMDETCAWNDPDDNDPNLPCPIPDADNDGFIAVECGGNDCNDTISDINPNATETCGDGVDADCDGQDSNGYILGDPCGTDTCAGTLVCDGLFATKCDSEGVDCGICCVCDSTGEQAFDGGQDNDCGVTVCPDSGCGIGGCGEHIWGYYSTNISNECIGIFECSQDNCTVECEEDFDGDNYSPTCGDCDDINLEAYPREMNEYTNASCDGIDNNCNNQTDEFCPCIMGDVQECGTNNCIGTQACDITGSWGDCLSKDKDCGICCICDAGGSETYDEAQNDDCTPTPCTEGDGCGADGCAPNIWGNFEGAGSNICAAKGTCTENECIANCEADDDKDLYSKSCGDCDDTNRRVKPPDINELEKGMIDGIDNDCDGVVDDSLIGGEEVEVRLGPELVAAERLGKRYDSIREKLNWFLLLMMSIVALVIIFTVYEYHKHVRRLQKPRRGAPPEEYPGVGEQPPMYPGQPPIQPPQQ